MEHPVVVLFKFLFAPKHGGKKQEKVYSVQTLQRDAKRCSSGYESHQAEDSPQRTIGPVPDMTTMLARYLSPYHYHLNVWTRRAAFKILQMYTTPQECCETQKESQ